jgi:hypothetical protein
MRWEFAMDVISRKTWAGLFSREGRGWPELDFQ